VSPDEKALGYVSAALTSLGIAARILPDDHESVGKLNTAIEKVARLHTDLGGEL
jgi:hypothetical protein